LTTAYSPRRPALLYSHRLVDDKGQHYTRTIADDNTLPNGSTKSPDNKMNKGYKSGKLCEYGRKYAYDV